MEKTITNVNECICAWRLVNDKPAFCVNWTENGQNEYKFFSLRSFAYNFAERLRMMQKTA